MGLPDLLNGLQALVVKMAALGFAALPIDLEAQVSLSEFAKGGGGAVLIQFWAINVQGYWRPISIDLVGAERQSMWGPLC